jgi:peptidoglycan/xylan/chitin deacetylase (PgdA/CDA1 family)
VLARSPLQAAAHAVWRRRLRVLAYHDVPDVDLFAAQLDWLTTHMTPVSLDDVREHVVKGSALPPHPVLLTFDDGDRSVLEVAAPLLRARGVPAVVYVVAGLIGTDQPFWWIEVEQLTAAGGAPGMSAQTLVRRFKRLPDSERRKCLQGMRDRVDERVRTPQLNSEELRELERGGVEVGSHSLTHPCLDTCDDDTLGQEVHEAHALLTGMLGHPPVSFAYPNGNWDDRVRSEVASAGYQVAFTFDHRLVASPTDPLSISRIRTDASADLDRFRLLVSGLHSGLHHLRGRT